MKEQWMTKRDLPKKATSFSKAGFKIFKCSGKRPSVQWRQHPYIEPSEVEEYLKDWTGNYGIAPNKRQLVIDIDPRNFRDGDRPHTRLFEACGISPKNYTTTVQSGGGGLHLYLTLPPLPAGYKVRKNHPDYIGIDFISDGAYVIGPGSIHPETNNYYTLLENFPQPSDMVEAPQVLIDLISTEKPQIADLDGVDERKQDDEQAVIRFKDFLDKADPAVQGDSGDAHTYGIACKGRDFGLTAHTTLELMEDLWNCKCTPEWSIDQLTTKVKNAYKYAENIEVGVNHPAADFEPVHGEAIGRHHSWRGWDRKETGKLEPTNNNLVCFFTNKHEDPDNPLLDCVVFNDFTGEAMKTKWMPWDEPKGKRFPTSGLEWTDSDSICLKHYLSNQKKFNISFNEIEFALLRVAKFTTVHPVKDYLNELEWDGVPRLEDWLIKASAAKDNSVNRALSKCMIMQAVHRIYSPGCQADMVIILEGAQGIGKTRLVRLLGGDYYGCPDIDPGNKDTFANMQGLWFIEMPEMTPVRKKEADDLKAFITSKSDKFRPAYARRPINLPRQSVIVGTHNPDATGEYFVDNTGNRRFGPIDLGSKRIDEPKIAKMRDQLFAEASHLTLNGEPCHITNERVLKELQSVQESRLSTDSFSHPIQDYVIKNEPFTTTTNDVWVEALGGDIKNCTTAVQRRIGTVLRTLGYYRSNSRYKGRSRKVFMNPDYKRTPEIEGLLDD